MKLLLFLAFAFNVSSFLIKTIPFTILRSKISTVNNDHRLKSILKMSNEEYVDEEGDSINNSGITSLQSIDLLIRLM